MTTNHGEEQCDQSGVDELQDGDVGEQADDERHDAEQEHDHGGDAEEHAAAGEVPLGLDGEQRQQQADAGRQTDGQQHDVRVVEGRDHGHHVGERGSLPAHGRRTGQIHGHTVGETSSSSRITYRRTAAQDSM